MTSMRRMIMQRRGVYGRTGYRILDNVSRLQCLCRGIGPNIYVSRVTATASKSKGSNQLEVGTGSVSQSTLGESAFRSAQDC